jgi:hypothetical protein
MKHQLLMASVVGVGFLAGLGIAAVRGDLRQPAAARVQELAEQAAPEPVMPAPSAALPLPVQPAAAAAATFEPHPEGGESGDALAAPTYDQEIAARDRAARRGARSH